MITRGNIAQHELVGLNVRIVSSPDPAQTGQNGSVVDETRNTLVIRRENGHEIRVQKAGAVFEFAISGQGLRLNGNDIQFRPEDRIKKCRK